jgi:AcrR family transcriptional regulator
VPRAKQRTPELREHVLQVALAMLAAEGPSSLTARGVAARSQTSTPAVYELFGDKAGLLRQLFFEGFLRLRRQLEQVPDSDDPRQDLEEFFSQFRRFVRDNPGLAQLMFARPLAELEPGPDEQAAGEAVRGFLVHRVRRCLAAGVIEGDETDIAHVLLALAQGLAVQESGGWLGRTPAAADRRWALAVRVALDGLAAPG